MSSLGGDDDPGAALAFGCQTLGDRLQVGHQLGVVGDVLPHLVDEKFRHCWPGFLSQPGQTFLEILDGAL